MSNDLSPTRWSERIRIEHEELREILGRVHRALSQPPGGDDVAEMLLSLFRHIETHFADEEQPRGLYEEIVQQAPRLSSRADSLRDEHRGLCDLATAMCELSNKGDGSDDWWKTLSEVFHDFSKELMAHEGKEIELLQDAFEDDIGAAD